MLVSFLRLMQNTVLSSELRWEMISVHRVASDCVPICPTPIFQADGHPAYNGVRGLRMCKNNTVLLSGGTEGHHGLIYWGEGVNGRGL